MFIHGSTRRNNRTLTYQTWANMIQRCTNTNNPDYHRYGGRGIMVCDRWRMFEDFLADMGERPPGLSLERKDNDKGYGPDNCVWATQRSQCRNQEKTVLVAIDGVVRPRIEWCEAYGIADVVVRRRINSLGWDPVLAITTPIRVRSNDPRTGKLVYT